MPGCSWAALECFGVLRTVARRAGPVAASHVCSPRHPQGSQVIYFVCCLLYCLKGCPWGQKGYALPSQLICLEAPKFLPSKYPNVDIDWYGHRRGGREGTHTTALLLVGPLRLPGVDVSGPRHTRSLLEETSIDDSAGRYSTKLLRRAFVQREVYKHLNFDSWTEEHSCAGDRPKATLMLITVCWGTAPDKRSEVSASKQLHAP